MALQGWDKNYREQLKIQQQQIESLQQQLMIGAAKPGQRPGDDRTKEPYDKDWPPPAPLKPKLAHGEYFDEYGQPIQDPTRGMDPSGNPITIPHLQQTPEEAEQNRQLHMDKYHPKNDLQISGLNLGGGRYLHNYEIKMLRDAFTGASEKERNRLLEMYSDKPFKGLV